jgi:sterol 3beta-glucosyltransferase
MKITICVIGSRGDVQPAVALGKGLTQAGHDVRLFTHEMFADLARAHSVEFVPLPGDPSEALITTAAVEMGNNPVRFVRWLKQNFRPVLRDLFRLTLETATGSDLVLGSSLSLAAFPVAERLGIPAISFQLQPTTVTRAFAGATVAPPPAWLPFKGAYNVVATKLANQTVLQLLRPLTDECRRDLLDLPPLGIRRWWNVDSPRDPTPIVYAYSAALVPRPSDWGPFKQVSGYWFLDAAVAYEPPQALASFLDRGPPPVYVGTGSMVDHAAEEMNHIVREAIGQTGQRAILHRGWSGLGAGDLPDSILVVDDVPHDWLFPRCAAVVHHGGAGTTAAGLRAGRPTVVVPFFLDQFFWAWRVHELGVGPHGIPRKRLTVERLSAAVRRAVEDDTMRARAAAIGERIRGEDGVARGISLIEDFARVVTGSD